MTPHPPPKMTQGGNDPPNPPPSPSTASLSGVARCWHSSAYFSLFSSLFFFDPPNRFVQIPRDLSWFRSCWLCYFRYSRVGATQLRGFRQQVNSIENSFHCSSVAIRPPRTKSGDFASVPLSLKNPCRSTRYDLHRFALLGQNAKKTN